MNRHRTPLKHHVDAAAMAVLVVLCASWGLQQVTIKVANQGISPLFQAGLRSAGSAALIGLWMVIRRKPIFEKDGTLWWGMAAGLLFAGEFLFVYWGLVYTNASRATVFLNMSPFVVAAGAHLFIPGERLRWIQIVGLGCAFAGILAAFGESMGQPSPRMLIGDAMLVAGAVFWGATTVLIKAGPLSRIHPGKTLLYQVTVSALALPAASWVKGEAGITVMTPVIAACLAYQTVWVAFVTYTVWFWLIGRYPPSRLASFTFLTPLFGVMAGGLLLNEPITPRLTVALFLVGSGIYLVNGPVSGKVAS